MSYRKYEIATRRVLLHAEVETNGPWRVLRINH